MGRLADLPVRTRVLRQPIPVEPPRKQSADSERRKELVLAVADELLRSERGSVESPLLRVLQGVVVSASESAHVARIVLDQRLQVGTRGGP
jgi:hypothetical protein